MHQAPLRRAGMIGMDKKSTTLPRAARILHEPVRNKGTAFTASEREILG